MSLSKLSVVLKSFLEPLNTIKKGKIVVARSLIFLDVP